MSGHYTAFIKIDEAWYLFDDDRVSKNLFFKKRTILFLKYLFVIGFSCSFITSIEAECLHVILSEKLVE